MRTLSIDISTTKRIILTTKDGAEFKISECHLTGGLIFNKSFDDKPISIEPRVSNEILIK